MDRSFRTPSRTVSRSSSYTDRSQSTIGYMDMASANISVVARFRPLLEKESDSILQEFTDSQCQIKIAESVSDFTFDRVYGPSATQEDVFEYCKSTVGDVLAGYNGTILAYGQSGAGKTTTLMGPKLSGSSRGLIPRIVDHIWNEKSSAHRCSVAYFEIYKERVKDLLEPSKGNLPVHENTGGGFYVKNLTWEDVNTREDVYAKMTLGNTNRAVGSTGCNSQSSRSHSLFAIQITLNSTQKGLLYLVDLAGSEKVSKTRATGKVLEEAKSINRSLSTLGMVINALTDPKIGHVPYRDSKLTRILQESLGGNSRTTLIIHCAQSLYDANETLSTLRFGTRAKAVRNRPILNVDTGALKFELLKQELFKWRSGIEVPLGDRVEFERSPSSLSCLSYHERRRSLTSPRAQFDSSRQYFESPRSRLFMRNDEHSVPEDPSEDFSDSLDSNQLETIISQLQRTTTKLQHQNKFLMTQNIKLKDATHSSAATVTALEKHLATVESELKQEDAKLTAAMELLGPRISLLNIY